MICISGNAAFSASEIAMPVYSETLFHRHSIHLNHYSNAARNEHCQTNRPAQGGSTMPAIISFRPSDRHRQLLLPRTWSEASFRFWAYSRRCHPKAEHRKQDTVSRKAGAYCQNHSSAGAAMEPLIFNELFCSTSPASGFRAAARIPHFQLEPHEASMYCRRVIS